MPVRLNPLLEPTHDVILVGDPRRAFALAQTLTEQPVMSHLARGLWGYRGKTAGGLDLTVQSTGIGGPSAVAVIADLVELGSQRLIRLGSCVSLADANGVPATGDGAAAAGSAFLVSKAHCGDGAGRSLSGGDDAILPDGELRARLDGIAQPAEVFSSDLVPSLDRAAGDGGAVPPPGVILRDLQTSATFAAARSLGVSASAVLVVAEDGSGRRLEEPELEALFNPIGLAAVEAIEKSDRQISNPQLQG